MSRSQGSKVVKLDFFFFFFPPLDKTGMMNNKSCLASMLSSLLRKKGHFPPFLSGNDWVRKGNSDFLSKFPVTVWTHEMTSRCVSAGAWWDLVVLKPPLPPPPVVIYDVRSGPVITAPPVLFFPASMKRDGEIINAFVSLRTSLTHLTPFNKWCPIFSHSL